MPGAMWTALVGAMVVMAVDSAASCGGGKSTCAAEAGARPGGALLQTSSEKGQEVAAHNQAPLKGRIVTLEAEVASLFTRVEILTDSVGKSLLQGAPKEAALLGEKPFERYASLLHSKSSDVILTQAVEELEMKVAKLKDDIQTLENSVAGNAFSAPSLMDVKAKGASLSVRVVALEDEVAKDRSRVTALEQTVVG
mmetsp:Transcript_72988/g.156302  ORF Transcript_72988/g.156302 Transcript_72988/m.156302 type:complete len:196 (-) Transcript_72988:142-729(-)